MPYYARLVVIEADGVERADEEFERYIGTSEDGGGLIFVDPPWQVAPLNADAEPQLPPDQFDPEFDTFSAMQQHPAVDVLAITAD
jgi:hypothetical protein